MGVIVLAGGGTAGHVIPHLALLPRLKECFNKIYYIGGHGGIERDIIERQARLPFFSVTCARLVRGAFFGNLGIPYKLLCGRGEALILLKELKPDVVFSKGGFASVPVVLAAAKLKIPVVAHESDFTPGLANRMTVGRCRAVCATFANAAEKMGAKGVFTGAPIRAELYRGDGKRLLSEFRFSNSKPVLLITGGSSGAATINSAVRAGIDGLTARYNVLHITGKGNTVPDRNPAYVQTEFTDRIQDFFAAADLVVSRAGSNTIFELLALRKPMLLIPLPKGASRGDQIENAEYFRSRNLAHVLPQSELTAQTLTRALNELYADKARLTETMRTYPAPDGTENILKEILKFAHHP
jgi:UDP-N-acetylglucosamine--N-acetylmuramyl-(pentapeptide) pyrophosphoryl-undecaprenol N-acetylglucosamine transferase